MTEPRPNDRIDTIDELARFCAKFVWFRPKNGQMVIEQADTRFGLSSFMVMFGNHQYDTYLALHAPGKLYSLYPEAAQVLLKDWPQRDGQPYRSRTITHITRVLCKHLPGFEEIYQSTLALRREHQSLAFITVRDGSMKALIGRLEEIKRSLDDSSHHFPDPNGSGQTLSTVQEAQHHIILALTALDHLLALTGGKSMDEVAKTIENLTVIASAPDNPGDSPDHSPDDSASE